MSYAIAAILMLYGLVCLLWPRPVFLALQGGLAKGLPGGYIDFSAWVIRLLGLAIVIAVPAIFLLGLDA